MNRPLQKNLLYEQVARIGNSLSSPQRLELIELLAQDEKSVETLTVQAGIDVRPSGEYDAGHLPCGRSLRFFEAP